MARAMEKAAKTIKRIEEFAPEKKWWNKRKENDQAWKVSIDEIPDPNPDYREIYDPFGGAASWHNMNMTPDFPSAARAALGQDL